ncbi:14374_t:CDS:1, partial [Cetraspora pellucida]
LAPEHLPRLFFGWTVPLLKISESKVLDHVGLDAAVYSLSSDIISELHIFKNILLSSL